MKELVTIGLSGGVDSCVAAFLLTKQYSHVIGASHYIWPESLCCSSKTLKRAEQTCEKLGILYYIIDLVREFKNEVVDDFTVVYLAGKTPNPCVRCNEKIRFDLFYQALEKKLKKESIMEDADTLYFATGHYVRTIKIDGEWYVRKGKDPLKDQSYMLYRMPRHIIPFLRFPLGEYTKQEVTDLAYKQNLPAWSVKESQDICFVDGDYKRFIRWYIKNPGCRIKTSRAAEIDRSLNIPGDIVDMSGKFWGTHKGYINYTIGQRQGLGLSNGPWYVAAIDAQANRVVVGRKDEVVKDTFYVNELHWFGRIGIGRAKADQADACQGNTEQGNNDYLLCRVKVRYNSPEISCTVRPADCAAGDGNMVQVKLENPASISPGQSAVFYDDDIVLGGGIIY